MSRPELLEQIATKAREVRAAQRAYFAASRAGRFRGVALHLAARVVDRAVEAGLFVSRQLGGAACWACVLRGVR